MEYVTIKEIAEQWGISKRRVQVLCSEGRIPGVIRRSNMWLLPKDSVKPDDGRLFDVKKVLYEAERDNYSNMPIVKNMKVKCVICGNESNHNHIIGSISSNYMDLDTRPSGLKRNKLPYDIQECPFCHYANSSIDKEIKGVTVQDINEKKYQNILNMNKNSKITKFELSAELYSNIGDYKKAGLLFLSTAWMLDDELVIEESQEMRKKSIICFEKYLGNNIDYDIAVLILDLYRRTHQFEKCIENCLALKKYGLSSNVLLKITEFQIKLSNMKDANVHNTLECLEWYYVF